MKIHQPVTHAAAQVHYTLSVLDSRGRTVRRLPTRRNLILNQGLDGIVTRSWVASFSHAVVGTGTDPTKRDSGAVTVSRAGSTLTSSAGFFEAADVGRLFKFDTGEEVTITAFTDSSNVTTADAGAIAAAEGTIWCVNQTALVTEAKRTATYSMDGGANGSSFAVETWTHKRTFIFSAEVGGVTYREIGWAHTAAAGANLFGRDLLAGVGVTLVAGQQLKVVVELSVAYSPVSPAAYSNVITGGFGGDGDACIEWVEVAVVNANGTSGAVRALDVSDIRVCSLSTLSVALANGSVGPVRLSPHTSAGAGLSKAAYVAGSFQLVESCEFGVGVGNRSDWRSILIGATWSANASLIESWYRILLDAPAEKLSTHKLGLTFTHSWGRVLVN